MTDTNHAEIRTLINLLGLTYDAEFVPRSRSRDPEAEQINWRVKFGPIETDYSAGIGHLPGLGQKYLGRRPVAIDDEIRAALESGKVPTDWEQVFEHRFTLKRKPIPAPDVLDVAYCLVSDADAIDYPDFEDWAADLGYDPDSRKGEKAYRACLEIALKLRAAIGDEGLQKLRDAFQDY